LKQLLASEKGDGFFRFDGAKLLYSLDSAQASVVADAVLRADISQVNAATYRAFSLQVSAHKPVSTSAKCLISRFGFLPFALHLKFLLANSSTVFDSITKARRSRYSQFSEEPGA
jgi:hypothetical protein